MPNFDRDQVNKIRRGELKTADVLPIEADHVASVMLVGHLFCEQGKTEDARKIFEGLYALDSRNPFVNSVLGSIYQKQQLFRQAVDHYSRAIAVFPQDIQSLTNRGEILLRFGRLKEAAADFKTAIDLDPQRKDPAANRSRLLAELARQSLEVARNQGHAATPQQLEALITSKD